MLQHSTSNFPTATATTTAKGLLLLLLQLLLLLLLHSTNQNLPRITSYYYILQQRRIKFFCHKLSWFFVFFSQKTSNRAQLIHRSSFEVGQGKGFLDGCAGTSHQKAIWVTAVHMRGLKGGWSATRWILFVVLNPSLWGGGDFCWINGGVRAKSIVFMTEIEIHDQTDNSNQINTVLTIQ